MRTQILIVGAGPVGLLLANLLGQKKIDTLLVEKRSEASRHSKAIGITPPSLRILAQLGLEETFISEGVRITDAHVHGKKDRIGQLSFSALPGPYQFILSFPQRRTEEILRRKLESFQSIQFLQNHECIEYSNHGDRISARVRTETGGTLDIDADYLCACDGFRSSLRQLSGIGMPGREYSDTFLMGDYRDRSGLEREAHLFFTPSGSVESFPLPGSFRRWVVQTPFYMEDPDPDYLESSVFQRSGFALDPADREWTSPFRIYSRIMTNFYRGRLLFLGDAAHTIPPIGGQGMNTGFGDAEHAAGMLASMLEGGYSAGLLRSYSRHRRKAAVTAAGRAILSMKTGTIQGRIASALRNGILTLLLASPFKHSLSKHYAMLAVKGISSS
ncbi:NAD(P)/FAD-dependent oxidoreductase [Marispirochaeta aestuarii]|uniref:FAD-dependent oxidoreductase n=1 Tax=Marispirochaeta aestuarii TaxID=1963862 RepID=UPI002ABE26A6|nr:NAD(P)/FAD-dependent oxidoreductase [Marispirochaeta aestuarii]